MSGVTAAGRALGSNEQRSDGGGAPDSWRDSTPEPLRDELGKVPLSARARKKQRRRMRWEASWLSLQESLEADGIETRLAAHRVLCAHRKRVVQAAVSCKRTFDLVVRKLHEAISSGELEPEFVLGAVDGKLAQEAVVMRQDVVLKAGAFESTHILSFLSVPERSEAAVASVCRAWEAMSRQPSVWRDLDCGGHASQSRNWSRWMKMIDRKSYHDLERYFERFQTLERIRVTSGFLSHLDWFLASSSCFKEITLVDSVHDLIKHEHIGRADSMYPHACTFRVDDLERYGNYDSWSSVHTLAMALVFDRCGSDQVALPDMPLLESLDLRCLLHSYHVTLPQPSGTLRRLSLVWRILGNDALTTAPPLGSFCSPLQLEEISLIGVPWSLAHHWLLPCSWSLPKLRVLRLSFCEDAAALRSLVAKAACLQELCVLRAPPSFWEYLPGLMASRPFLKLTVGSLQDNEWTRTPPPDVEHTSLPMNLALDPAMLDLEEYRVCIRPFANASWRNATCMRLLELRVERPGSIFRVSEALHRRHGETCHISLHVSRNREPIIASVKSSAWAAMRQQPIGDRPRLTGKHIFRQEYGELLSPWDYHLTWSMLPEAIQAAFSGPIANAYNMNLRYVESVEPESSEDD